MTKLEDNHTCTLRTDSQLHIAEEWQCALADSGLASFADLIRFSGGQRLSWHKNRSEVYRAVLAGGHEAFIKKALSTERLELVHDIATFHRPCSMLHKEKRAIDAVAGLGILVPRVIAFGQRLGRLGPMQSVMVMLPLPGRPLADVMRSEDGHLIERAFQSLRSAIATIFNAGFCWPDLLPKHVYVQDDGSVGFLDLERLHAPRIMVRIKQASDLRRFILKLAKYVVSPSQLDLAHTCLAQTGLGLPTAKAQPIED